jgi:hypothetical protein
MINKYVIIKGQPILFSDKIVHADVVKSVKDVESAGFIITNNIPRQDMKIISLGASTSLAINSHPETDENIIRKFLTMEY